MIRLDKIHIIYLKDYEVPENKSHCRGWYNLINDIIYLASHDRATLYHELIHWTGHFKRLNRLEELSKLNISDEIIAEIGTVVILKPKSLEPHKRYLRHLSITNEQIPIIAKYIDEAVGYILEKKVHCLKRKQCQDLFAYLTRPND